VSELKMAEAFRKACETLGITEEGLQASLTRSNLMPRELLTLSDTTSPRNFRISYENAAGAVRWAHLFLVPKPASEA